MGLSRRTTIIGIGTLAVGGGVIGGSGAFDSVEANRSFEVGVTGDGSALLGLEATNTVIAGTESSGAGGNDVIYFALTDDQGTEASLNENATTWFYDVMRVTNNGSQSVTLSIELGGGISGVSFLIDDENDGVAEKDLGETGHTLAVGETGLVDLRIDTTSDGGYVEPSGSDPYQVTIRAIA